MSEIPAILVDSLQRAPWGWALLITVLLALIKVWPVLALQAIKAKEQLRGEKRADLADCHRKCDTMADELSTLQRGFHGLELKLLGAITAYRILDVECEANLPGSTALSQARAALSAAFTISPSTDEEMGPARGPAEGSGVKH